MAGCRNNQPSTSKLIEGEVRQALPTGAAMKKVDLYLTSHNVEHSLYKKDNRIYAIYRNVHTSSNGSSENLSLIFSFDTNNTLTNIQSEIAYTGL
jgi:hypothetical protein